MISISEFPPIPGNQTPIWHTKEVYKLVLFVRAFIYLGMPFGACHCTPGEEQKLKPCPGLSAQSLPWALAPFWCFGTREMGQEVPSCPLSWGWGWAPLSSWMNKSFLLGAG